jgi:glycosyltransferase involved in cell wall biosynthesis
MAKGEVFIIPLRIGGGMRGKALEAMAMRRPIVTTTLGCEGINLNHEESALFADTPEAFAESVLRMFNDAALRERLTAQAYNNVVEGYTWDTHGESLNTLYKMLVPSNGAGAKPAAQASPMRLQNAR